MFIVSASSSYGFILYWPHISSKSYSVYSKIRKVIIHLCARSSLILFCHFVSFSRLQLPCLDMKKKWSFAISLFMKDLQFVQSEYNAHRLNPPPNRDLPPLVGKISWSRQLYHRISQPIKIIQKETELLKAPETRKAIKSFNKLAQVISNHA